MTLPLPWIREQFPALRRGDALYLDNAAGAQVPEPVIARVVQAMREMQVNKGGAYAQSRRVTEAKERVRAQVAAFLNAPEAGDVAFGPNATTLIELLAQALGRDLEPGDEIIVTGLDHHANLDPWRRLAARGAVIKVWPARLPGRLELRDLTPLLGERTRWLAMTAASNALGTLTPVAEAAAAAHAAGAQVMADAVHYAPHALPDVRAWGVDALVFSPYKLFGPHLGALYLSRPLRERLPGPGLAFFAPGEIINWEPGTQNHEAIAGFGGVFDYLDALACELGVEGDGRARWQRVFAAFHRHETALLERLLAGLARLGAERYGEPGSAGRTATVSFNLPGLAAPQVAEALGREGIAVASGHYYAYGLMMEQLGLAERGGAVRAGLLHYNTAEEVDALLEALERLAGA